MFDQMHVRALPPHNGGGIVVEIVRNMSMLRVFLPSPTGEFFSMRCFAMVGSCACILRITPRNRPEFLTHADRRKQFQARAGVRSGCRRLYSLS